jgi:Dolichyl-phosphate-mannose-protein mannosyltransferase
MARSPLVVVGALTLIALALRLPLMRDSLLGDELIMFGIVHDRGLHDVLSIVHDTEKTPPLHFVLAWASARIGDPTLWIRLPSLLAGVALVPVAYALGRDTVGQRAGLVAAAIVALQPYGIFYATEARAYSLVALFAGLSTVFLLRALETNRRGWWAAYGLAVLGVAYTHYVGIFVLAAQLGWALWVHRERLRELLIVHALILLAYVPWIPSYIVQQGHSADEARRIELLAPQSFEHLTRVHGQLLFGQPFVGFGAVPGWPALLLATAVLAIALAAAAFRTFRGARPTARGVLVVLLAAATPVGIFLLSVPPEQSFLLPRNLIASLPAIAVVAGWALTALGRRAALAAVALLVLALAAGSAQALEHANRRSPYRDVARYIDERARPGDPVIQHYFLFNSGSLADVLKINFDRSHPHYEGGGATEEAAWEQARETGRAFVVLPLPGYFKEVEHMDERAGPGGDFELVAEQRYSGLEDILVGEYRPADR